MGDGDGNMSAIDSPGQDESRSLGGDQLLKIYRQMVLCRTLDERVWMLNRQGKAALVASSQGHEAAQAGSVAALRVGDDHLYIYYRDLAVLISAGMTPREVILGFMARAGEPLSGARQFPVHGAYPKYRLYNISNVVATHLPQAAGAALASAMRGEDSVVIAYFGDGASSTGDCHESMNFAGIHKLPIIFFCENNKYAISVPLAKQMAIDSIASRAEGYGMPGVRVDGCDVGAVYEATHEAVRRARAGEGPTLIEAMVERLLPHTGDDDDSRYRTEEEMEEVRKRDPIKILKDQLTKAGILSAEADEEIRGAAKREVNEATEFAESAPYPGTEDFYDHVYSPSGGAPSP